ncbi:hypothetical protein BCR44DRAFT_1189830 [Catenaria anguillulae PL171]|uniref:Uncharacterized protein n=1 Tax=Catenaria anguillulae PL171 TaxID=765915 RepID=A0A1Y2HGL3_9FUNG|nr:hypothetical protein BCR44DRAFT_1189830 [Catenaria anguillulae PL171]
MLSILKSIRDVVRRKRRQHTEKASSNQRHGQSSLESFELRPVVRKVSLQEKDSAVDELSLDCSNESLNYLVAHELPLDQTTLELAQALAAKCVYHFFAPNEKHLFDLLNEAPGKTSETLKIAQELAKKCDQLFAKWVEPEPKRVSWRDQSLYQTQSSVCRELYDVYMIPSRHNDPQFLINWDIELSETEMPSHPFPPPYHIFQRFQPMSCMRSTRLLPAISPRRHTFVIPCKFNTRKS